VRELLLGQTPEPVVIHNTVAKPKRIDYFIGSARRLGKPSD
jgi:hypothetical protein